MEGPGTGTSGRVEEGQWCEPSSVLRGHGKGKEEESRGGEKGKAEQKKMEGRKEVKVMEKKKGEVKNFPGKEKTINTEARESRGKSWVWCTSVMPAPRD